jgi:hypothetical protein
MLRGMYLTECYPGLSKIFRTDAVRIINLTTKRVWKLPTSTQLIKTWHTDSLDTVVIPFTGASRYHIFCSDGGTSPQYFGLTLVKPAWSILLVNCVTKSFNRNTVMPPYPLMYSRAPVPTDVQPCPRIHWFSTRGLPRPEIKMEN